MSRVVAVVHVSIDGVLQETPWTDSFWCQEHAELQHALLFASRALLLGRPALDRVMRAWPQAGYWGDFAALIQKVPKYVVSETPIEPGWNTIRITGDVAGEVARLRDEPGGDLLIHDSGDLIDHLIGHGLLDELKLFIRPVLLGTGPRLLREAVGHTEWQFTGASTFRCGVVVLDYRPDPLAHRTEADLRPVPRRRAAATAEDDAGGARDEHRPQ